MLSWQVQSYVAHTASWILLAGNSACDDFHVDHGDVLLLQAMPSRGPIPKVASSPPAGQAGGGGRRDVRLHGAGTLPQMVRGVPGLRSFGAPQEVPRSDT